MLLPPSSSRRSMHWFDLIAAASLVLLLAFVLTIIIGLSPISPFETRDLDVDTGWSVDVLLSGSIYVGHVVDIPPTNNGCPYEEGEVSRWSHWGITFIRSIIPRGTSQQTYVSGQFRQETDVWINDSWLLAIPSLLPLLWLVRKWAVAVPATSIEKRYRIGPVCRVVPLWVWVVLAIAGLIFLPIVIYTAFCIYIFSNVSTG